MVRSSACSKPRPASTLTASRSSASGRATPIASRRFREREPTTKSGTKKPSAAKPAAKRVPPPNPPKAPPKSTPTKAPPAASTPFAARKLVGGIVMPAASSLAATESTVDFGLARRTSRATFWASGATTLSLNFASSGPCRSFTLP